MTVLYVKDETVDNVVIENCTFNQQGSELTIIDTTDTAATVTINSLSIRDIEWDYSVASATSDRALKLKNVKNFTVTGGHWNCGGTVTAVAELENTNLVNCEGLYIRSAALFFDVDSDSTINLGRNYTDTSNVTRIVNDSAPGVIPVTWTAGNVLILGHTGAGNGHTIYEISPTSGSGWTLSYRHGSAGYLVPGQMITIRIKNASGGAISAGTPVSTFRTTAALVAPEDGYSRYYTFIWDGSAWNEVSRSEKDVSNSGTNTATGVIIDNSQRLGIGTAPSDLLHLSSSSPVIRGDDSDGGSAKINFGSGNITLDADHGSAQGSSIINFKVDGTEAGRFTDDGTLDLKSEKLKLNGSGGSADQVLKTDGSGNVSWSGGPAEIGIACSDETSALTEGECATVMVPKGLTIKEVKASLTEAGSSGGVQVNVKYHASNPNSAASIFTTSSALTIATSDYKNNITTFTDGSGGSQSTYTAAEDGFLVVDIPSSSSPDSAARGLKVWVLGEWS